jgi:hypothetical protein
MITAFTRSVTMITAVMSGMRHGRLSKGEPCATAVDGPGRASAGVGTAGVGGNDTAIEPEVPGLHA